MNDIMTGPLSWVQVKEEVQKSMSSKRWAHTKGVISAAKELAKRYNVSTKEAKWAALLHDCCKEYPLEYMRSLLIQSGQYGEEDTFWNYPVLWHGPAGALVSQIRYGVSNPAILEAVRVHTIGKIGMSDLDKVIFLADYIEENRDFPGVQGIRKAANQSLNEGVLAGFDATITHLLEKQWPIYEGMMAARNSICREMRGTHE